MDTTQREIVTKWIWSITGNWLMKWLIDPLKTTFWISSINCLLEEFSIIKNWFPVKWFLKIKGQNSAHRGKTSLTTWPKSAHLAIEKGQSLGSWTVMGRRSMSSLCLFRSPTAASSYFGFLQPPYPQLFYFYLSSSKFYSDAGESCWLPTARSGHMPFPQLLSYINYWWTFLGSQSSNFSESTWQ